MFLQMVIYILEGTAMKFGVCSVAFGPIGYQELARKISLYGFRSTHLEMNQIVDIDHRLGRLSTGVANLVAEEFDRHGVRIPILGCYSNLIHPDHENRRYLINQFKEHLRFARDFGASAVSTETGTANRESQWDPHPDNQNEDNWKLLRNVVEEITEEAEKWGVFVGLEGFFNNVIDTPERMHRVLQEIPSSNIGIVMDPCNYIRKRDATKQDDIIKEAFDRLGDRILIAHAKDFNYRQYDDMAQPINIQPAAGKGDLNYPLYLRLLTEHKPNVEIYLEHLSEDEMFTSCAYVGKIMNQILSEKE
ncbi:sugar phosphate isomerase/epimerase family protein [Cohnella zeiphila]|uniref:Sugar phosphate isomerase/epimerase n=1 Tax=Cohnella zeiphila TaxID=2761120 RepID=A0A7X0SMJ8_9BACL|nr:sugar phosphate isomerase/epimerase [Cohnella zeiphila]MBB6732752.1 sugar phosphate isomerase/epimerase [Cohnella zeiphila]